MKSYSGITQQTKQAMRASFVKRQAKTGTGKHDGRNSGQGLEESQHIDPDRLEKDIFYTWLDTEEYDCKDFDEAILKFYETTYEAALNRINANYAKDRHPEKQKDMKGYLAQHMPESSILQIGNVKDNVDADTLVACFNDYMAWEEEWNKAHGYPFETLTVALHDDEATPHIHLTRAWRGIDKHGNVIPNREKALELAGVELPYPDKKTSRYNNRNVTFTAMCRDKWLDICEEHGLDIIREPIKGVKSKNKGDYIREREKDMKDREEALEASNRALIEAEIQNNQEAYRIASVSLLQADRDKELEELAKSIDAKEKRVDKVVTNFDNYMADKELSVMKREKALGAHGKLVNNAECMVEYLSSKGLLDDYNSQRSGIIACLTDKRLKLEAQMNELYRKYPIMRPKQEYERDFDR